ncbi:hypothetical protein L6R52_27885 [Myxococcota bacterium]|nr:hypothetical protein [Myxococcota bacterium]
MTLVWRILAAATMWQACTLESEGLDDAGSRDAASGIPVCEGTFWDVEDQPCPRVTGYCASETVLCCRDFCAPEFTCLCDVDGWQCSNSDLSCPPVDAGA